MGWMDRPFRSIHRIRFIYTTSTLQVVWSSILKQYQILWILWEKSKAWCNYIDVLGSNEIILISTFIFGYHIFHTILSSCLSPFWWHSCSWRNPRPRRRHYRLLAATWATEVSSPRVLGGILRCTVSAVIHDPTTSDRTSMRLHERRRIFKTSTQSATTSTQKGVGHGACSATSTAG